jgi:thioredoxin 1
METFNEIINGNKPVLVDFYATWCGPCRMMSPIVDEVGKEIQGEARVIKIDVDKNPAVADLYQVQSVPAFFIFKNRQVVWRHTGAVDKATLLRQIKDCSG